MAHEYWATFSIYDHREDYYRPSLLLFDRVVMPVPTRPWKGLSKQEELDQLSAEADWLEKEGCAVRYDWDPDAFAAWQAEDLAVYAATSLGGRIAAATQAGDRVLNTRYQLQWLVESGALRLPEVDPKNLTVVPVFASNTMYAAAQPDMLGVDAGRQQTLELVLEAFPVARADVPLEDVVRLRQSGFVTEQVGKLRAWQLAVVHDLIRAGDDVDQRRLRIETARVDLENALADYERAMMAHLDGQQKARWTTLFSVLNPLRFVERLVTEHAEDLALVARGERCWRTLHDEDFAFAGVICTARALT